ncbi:hypothetical protein P43SY_002287 [Pythium insidiosum]|uniref:RanBP-type and C3HC4-type zinc finger-containing protein 1 n=1 Tax=Pythium insidiosum TaxID=114742 RepID=A0AAD5M982_PYTIN|nr:hypothetical protein P43SY_002287 [Pythium insidiosum]
MAAGGGVWSCAHCTLENMATARSCAACLRPRAAPPAAKRPSASPSASAPPTAPKKPRAAFFGSVGSSKEQDALRLQRKMQQMRDLGIDLPDDALAELLARNCYCVHVAASEFFEQQAASETAADGDAAAQHPRVADALAFLESDFLGAPFRLLGRVSMAAALTRAGARLAVGDRVIFQGENVGRKRSRPSSSSGGGATGSPPKDADAVPAATADGIVRVSSMEHDTPLGRLDRDMERVFHPLLKEGLVVLGGVCVDAPPSSQVFAKFKMMVVVFVHPRAFDIFREGHALFHLSDLLYVVLDTMHSGSRGQTPLTAALAAAAAETSIPEDVDVLFSSFTGARDDGDATRVESLAPYLNAIELRPHQHQALAWMLGRETQSDAAFLSSNPLWEQRLFHDQEAFFLNPFEKIASLEAPSPPTPCRGGILADDMGMGKTMMMLSLIAHQKLFSSSGPDADPSGTVPLLSSRGRPRQTLIVCPLSLLHQWKREIEERFRPQTLRVFVYYGDDRDGHSSTASDVVLTTYGVLSSEFVATTKTPGWLLSTEWYRVILDEAHSIKTRTTTYFRSCLALKAEHRWCLTGTPLQNGLGDLFSLLCFLRYEPWCRPTWWTRVIARPMDVPSQSTEAGNAHALALARLQVILKPVLLRRTKLSRDADGNCLVQLPPRHIEVVELQFSAEERAFYQAVYDRSRAEFNGFVASGTTMSSYVAIFALLLRLRQACDHPLLALGRQSESAAAASRAEDKAARLLQRQANESNEAFFQRIAQQLQQETVSVSAASATDDSKDGSRPANAYIENVLAQIQEEGLDAQECPVCLDAPRQAVLTACAHLLCSECLRESVANDPENGCPVCRVPVDMAKVYSLADTQADADAAEATPNESQSGMYLSTKLHRLLTDIQHIRNENERMEDPAQRRKVVVFSQWTHMLEMVAQLLAERGVGHAVFHGSMPQEARERVLRRFSTDDSVEVLVISLRAGGVGLNLTRASVVLLLDPWWNPGVEDQAIDRVHRLGQSRDVLVRRYVVRDTVEDMILALQQRKARLARHVLVASHRNGADDQSSDRLSMEDLLAFFR